MYVGEAFRLPRDGRPVPYKSNIRLAQKINISHCNRLGAMRYRRYLIYASFPTTVLTVSGSRVKAISLISAGTPAPRRLSCYAIDYIIVLYEKLSTLTSKIPHHKSLPPGGRWQPEGLTDEEWRAV